MSLLLSIIDFQIKRKFCFYDEHAVEKMVTSVILSWVKSVFICVEIAQITNACHSFTDARACQEIMKTNHTGVWELQGPSPQLRITKVEQSTKVLDTMILKASILECPRIIETYLLILKWKFFGI